MAELDISINVAPERQRIDLECTARRPAKILSRLTRTLRERGGALGAWLLILLVGFVIALYFFVGIVAA